MNTSKVSLRSPSFFTPCGAPAGAITIWRSPNFRFVSDDERSAPGQHIIDFVLFLVRVDFLLLSGFQAINVAEEIFWSRRG